MIKIHFKLGGFKNMLGRNNLAIGGTSIIASQVKVMISLWPQIPGFPSWIYLGLISDFESYQPCDVKQFT